MKKNHFITLVLMFLTLCTLILLGGCATYQASPLSEKSALSNNIETLTLAVNGSQNENFTHTLNPSDGLDLNEVAILAVFGNPELRAKRANLKVADVQVFAAGLLPDPQFGVGMDKPTGISWV
jgi:hypothetical protein